MPLLLRSVAVLAMANVAFGLSTTEWQSQSIYQVITDRFAKSDNNTDACADLGVYCGGTWQGITNQLDYIQNMGFVRAKSSKPLQIFNGLQWVDTDTI